MGDDMPSWIVGVLGVALGGGVIGQIAQAISSHRVGVRNADVQEEAGEGTSQDRLIGRLEDRLDKVEQRLAVVEEELSEERTLKWILVRYAQNLLDYIARVIEPHETPDPPDPIRHYFPQHFPGKD